MSLDTGMVLTACRAVLRDHHAAEDACQAVFLALARQAAAFGRRGSAGHDPSIRSPMRSVGRGGLVSGDVVRVR